MKIKLEKLMLYPNEEDFDLVRDFYHELIGLEYLKEPTKWWVEFETGEASLCLHHDNWFKDSYGKTDKRQILAFELDSVEDVKNTHCRINKSGYDVADTFKTSKAKPLGALITTKDNSSMFLLRDPMGNIVRLRASAAD